MHEMSGFRAGHRPTLPAPAADPAVKTQSGLHHHPGQAAPLRFRKGQNETAAGGLQNTLPHAQTVLGQQGRAPALDPGVGIAGAQHHPHNASGQNRLGAGRRPATMIAGLQGHVQSRACRVVPVPPRIRQGVHLGVGLARPVVIAPAQNAALAHEQSAHRRIRAGPAQAPGSLGQRQFHIVLVALFHAQARCLPLSPRNCFSSAMNSFTSRNCR